MTFPTIPDKVKKEAEKPENRFDAYVKIETLEELKDHILHGSFIVFGATVGLGTFFKPLHLPNGDAVIQMPAGYMAGHCMYIVGFDDDMEFTFPNGADYHQNLPYMLKTPKTFKGFVKVAQSYGTEASRREFGGDEVVIWTKSGYGWIPYEYIFGGVDPIGDGKNVAKYVNEMYVLVKNMPVDVRKIDVGNENVKPIIRDGRTFVPLRFIGDMLGATTEFNNNKITITRGNDVIRMEIGKNLIFLNGASVYLDKAPFIENMRTLVPLRAISQLFNCKVDFLPTERKVEVIDEQNGKIIELWIDYNTARIISRKL